MTLKYELSYELINKCLPDIYMNLQKCDDLF